MDASSEISTRQRILDATAELFADSDTGDVSTRAICDRAGVTAPTLYHHFGDKNGLLDAVVANGFEQYLATKQATESVGDPLDDIATGWRTHVQFGLDHPGFYTLMYGQPLRTTTPPAAEQARARLIELLEHAHAAGTLTTAPPIAADVILGANSGITLTLLAQPPQQRNLDVSETLLAAVLTQLTRTQR